MREAMLASVLSATLHIRKETARLIATLAAPARLMILAAFAANLFAALFEGTTIGALTVALKVISGPANVSVADLLGRFGVWGGEMHFSREAAFLGLMLLAVIAQVFRSGLQFLAVAATAHVQVRVQSEAHRQLFSRMMRMSFPSISRYRLGDLTDYLGQARFLHDVFSHLNVITSNVLLILSYAGLLLWISWPMTVAAFGIYWVVSSMLRVVMHRVRHHATRATDATARFSQHTTEFLQAVRLVHTFARQEQAIETVDGLTRDWVSSRRDATMWSGSIPLIMDTVTVIGVAVFLVGGYALMGRTNTSVLPRLLAFLLALYRMAPRLGMVHGSRAALANLGPNIGRLGELLSVDEAPSQPTGTLKRFEGLRKAIVFEHVTLQYRPEELPAITDLSFIMPRGSFTAIVGASGAGKSSVADLLLRLYEPTSGAILLDKTELPRVDLASWREALGVVSQDLFLFHATLQENIAFGRPGATMEDVQAAARAAHAEEFILRLAQGYQTVVGDRGYRLSGGQRQRIALARALIRQPDILILDEATSALDSESERLIQQAMEEQRAVRTVLVIAHRLSTVAHANQILVLAEGQLAERGTHEELLARQGLYMRLWRLQSDVADRVEELPQSA